MTVCSVRKNGRRIMANLGKSWGITISKNDLDPYLAGYNSTMAAAFKEARTELGSVVKGLFGRFTKTWSTQPQITISVGAGLSGGGTGFRVEASSTDLRLVIADKGSRPHRIVPRNAKRLAFQSDFTPKTQPGQIDSGPGSRGGAWVFSKGVNHPGTKPRYITQTIYRELDKLAPDVLWKHIREALAKLKK